jgi:organic hydroperoxide reductase OsmC/OhrA
VEREHHYEVEVRWTGNDGSGTRTYTSYRRDHAIQALDKAVIDGSSDASFRGDPSRYNPEELLLASVSACHMLWYLHLCAVNGVVVLDYQDKCSAAMELNPDGSGAFTRATLNPVVTIDSKSDSGKAIALHEQAHHMCFIANSVRFPIHIAPTIAASPVDSSPDRILV